MFMRHLGLGVGHEPYRMQQEVNTEIGPDNGNDDNAEEMDDDNLSVNVDNSNNESEGEEELASRSNGNSEDSDSSDDLGYASF